MQSLVVPQASDPWDCAEAWTIWPSPVDRCVVDEKWFLVVPLDDGGPVDAYH